MGTTTVVIAPHVQAAIDALSLHERFLVRELVDSLQEVSFRDRTAAGEPLPTPFPRMSFRMESARGAISLVVSSVDDGVFAVVDLVNDRALRRDQ